MAGGTLRNWIKSVCFCVLGIVLLLGIQKIVSQKWYYPGFTEAPADMLEEFYQFSDDTDLQAAIFGASHSGFGIDPMAIYERSGITAFNFSSTVQPMPVSYYLCGELFKRQSPKIVLLDVNNLSPGEFNDSGYRAILDTAPFSGEKVELAIEYSSHFPQEKQAGALLGAFLPMYRYHSRWSKLTSVDFTTSPVRNLYRKGYYFTSRISPNTLTLDRVNWEAENLNKNVGWTRRMIEGAVSEVTEKNSLYKTTLDKTSVSYLKSMKQLCEEHGAKLILIKIPAIGHPQYYSATWTRLRSMAVKELAAELDLDFLDLFYDVDLGIDWTRETLDGGRHLNFVGTAKASAFLADYLEKECGLTVSAPV